MAFTRRSVPTIDDEHAVGGYLCQVCDGKFSHAGGMLVCPYCGSIDPEDLVPIYVEDDKSRREMITDDEWHAGD